MRQFPWTGRTKKKGASGKKKGVSAQCGSWRKQSPALAASSEEMKITGNPGYAPREQEKRSAGSPNTEENYVFFPGKAEEAATDREEYHSYS